MPFKPDTMREREREPLRQDTACWVGLMLCRRANHGPDQGVMKGNQDGKAGEPSESATT